MPTLREFHAMPVAEFVSFWRLYAETFQSGKERAQHIRRAIELREHGWEISPAIQGAEWLPPAFFRWQHPQKHHGPLMRPEVAHELDARGWTIDHTGKKCFPSGPTIRA